MTNNQRNHSTDEERRGRALTDEDIEELAKAMEDRLTARFYNNLGHGVWDLIWRTLIVAMLAVAAWGAYIEIHRG